jgi:hypothetical protein
MQEYDNFFRGGRVSEVTKVIWQSALKMEAVSFSETSMGVYRNGLQPEITRIDLMGYGQWGKRIFRDKR